MPRLRQGNMLPGNMLRGRATCCLYLGNMYPFVSSNRRATNCNNFVAGVGNKQHVEGNMLPDNMLPGVNSALQ